MSPGRRRPPRQLEGALELVAPGTEIRNAIDNIIRAHNGALIVVSNPEKLERMGVISGGTQPNVVPDVCRLRIDVRTVPGQDHREILNDIRSLAQEIEPNSPAKIELTVLNDKPSVSTPADEEIVGTAVRTVDDLFEKRRQPSGVRYFTDASVFVPGAGDGLPVIIYGPGDEALAHQPNEYVEVGKYLDAITFYKELALRYLG